MRKILFVVALGIIFLSNISFALTNIANCTEAASMIVTPDTYRLNASINSTFYDTATTIPLSESCIVINSSDVLLDCDSNYLNSSGSAAAVPIGILVNGTNFQNVTITNCRIDGYQYGIAVRSVTFEGNITNSIIFNTQNGIFVNDSSIFEVRNNTISSTIRPITFSNLSSSFVQYNSINGTYAAKFGINLTQSNIIQTHENNISSVTNNSGGSPGVAIYLSRTNNSYVQNSRAFDNIYGIYSQDSHSNIYLTNEVFNSTIGGVVLNISNYSVFQYVNSYLSGDDGFLLSNSHYNNFTWDNAYNNSVGFNLGQSSTNNLIHNSSAYNHNSTGSQTGYYFQNSPSNSIMDSNASLNGNYGFYIFDSDYSVIRNNIADSSAAYGFSVDTSNYVNLTLNNAHNNSLDGFSFSMTNGTTISQNQGGDNAEYGFYFFSQNNYSTFEGNTAFSNPVAVQILNASYSNFSSNTLENNSEVGFNISYSSNFNNYQYNKLSHLSNTGFSKPGGAGQGSNFTYNNITNTTTGLSISLLNANISNNRVGDNSNGIISSGSSNSIDSNYVFNNSVVGIRIISGATDTARHNTLINNTLAIQAYDLTGSNTVYNNTATSGTVGFQIGGSGATTNINVSSNTVNSNYVGFNLTSITTSTIERNTASNSNTYAFVLNSANQTNVSSNTANISSIAMYLLNTTNTSISNDHYFNTSTAGLRFNSSSIDGATINLTGVSFDSPTGGYTSYQNISLYDTAANETSYDILWTPSPAGAPSRATSFESKYINITNYSAATIDSFNVLWTGSEAFSYDETSLKLYRYSAGAWAEVSGSTLATESNQISSTPSTFGTFAIFAVTAPASSSDGTTRRTPRCSFDSECGDSETCIAGMCTPLTCTAPEIARSHVCVAPPTPACTVDTECGDSETCIAGMCTPLTCVAPATARSHACVAPIAPECRLDTDCAITETCRTGMCTPISCPLGRITDHRCIVIPINGTTPLTPECRSDSDCSPSSACSRGADGTSICTPVGQASACGEIRDHRFVAFACGSEPGCSPCGTGFTCQSHRCVAPDLLVPNRTTTGSEEQLRTILGSAPLPNGAIRITDPSGRTTTINTDSAGLARYRFTRTGAYRVELIQDGKVVRTTNINAVSGRGSGSLEEVLAAIADAVVNYWWLVLLIIVGAGYLLYRRHLEHQEGNGRTRKDRE
ncbi:right-handed parallel beta-helix repeat-containing protein [Candidatus Micrarchaeota archaeon]|nr:right-handed parallel beta-helix repeat-containing protein [Candidatus Micrarchaeota archaeon]